MDGMVYTTLATLLAVFYTFYLSTVVGRLRDVHGVNAPATAGNIDFERAFRTQQNTNEQLLLLLPCLWLAVPMVGDLLGGVLGLVWVGGRYIYGNA
ncbi:MAG: MAPEG family protein, partial [Sphingomonadales bacterium]